MNDINDITTHNDPTKSILAEQSVLGSILIDPFLINTASISLLPEDFFQRENHLIYKTMLDMYNEDIPIDLVVILSTLKDKGQLENAGGIDYISALPSVPDFSKNISEYIKIVKDKSNLRKIIGVSNFLIKSAYDGNTSKIVMEQAEQGIFDISQDNSHSTLSHIKESLLEAFENLEENYKNKKAITGLQTGYRDLDFKTKGLQDTDLIILAARPGTGKTAFALNLALNTALRDKSSVAIFSLEMSKLQLVQRLIAADSMVELGKIKDGNLEMEDFQKIYKTLNVLSSLDIFLDDTPGINMAQIRSKCRRQKIKGSLDLIIIDYLQLMGSEGKSESRQVEISRISRSLKILAKEMNCPVIALSQLSRAPEARAKEHRPILSDLRESGSIEQDADIVMFLYRDEMYNKDTDLIGITELIISKHRNGETGTIQLSWLGKYQKFLGLER